MIEIRTRILFTRKVLGENSWWNQSLKHFVVVYLSFYLHNPFLMNHLLQRQLSFSIGFFMNIESRSFYIFFYHVSLKNDIKTIATLWTLLYRLGRWKLTKSYTFYSLHIGYLNKKVSTWIISITLLRINLQSTREIEIEIM